jgi:hypothetical protein
MWYHVVYGTKWFNFLSAVPNKIKKKHGSFPIFKRELKSFLLSHAFYTIDEFIILYYIIILLY